MFDLKDKLIPLNDDEGREPSLLEDLETLQRNLKELTSIKQYVQVIERGLQLRSVLSLPTARTGRVTPMHSEQTLDTVRKSTSLSLVSFKSYKLLRSHVSSITQLFATSQEEPSQKLNLVSLLENIQDKTWSDIKASLFTSVFCFVLVTHGIPVIDIDQ